MVYKCSCGLVGECLAITCRLSTVMVLMFCEVSQ